MGAVKPLFCPCCLPPSLVSHLCHCSRPKLRTVPGEICVKKMQGIYLNTCSLFCLPLPLPCNHLPPQPKPPVTSNLITSSLLSNRDAILWPIRSLKWCVALKSVLYVHCVESVWLFPYPVLRNCFRCTRLHRNSMSEQTNANALVVFYFSRQGWRASPGFSPTYSENQR